MYTFKILIIEDDPVEVARIHRSLQRAFGTERPVEFVFATTTFDAYRKLHELALHGVSIDQNMPGQVGGVISREEGEKFIQKLEELNPPAFMAIYTGYPALDMANLAGLTGGIPYIVKSIETGSHPDGTISKTTREYGTWFVDCVQNSYIERVLRLVQESGFHMLREGASLAHETYERFADTEFTNDECAHDFMNALGMFRETFAITFAAYIVGVGRALEAGIGMPRDFTKAGLVEDWIERALNKLQMLDSSKEEFGSVCEYFHLQQKKRVAEIFGGGSGLIRKTRNDVHHNGRRYRCEDFESDRLLLFSFMDVVGWLVRRPMLNQPRKNLSREYLTYSELNRRRAKNMEIHYTGEMLEVTADRVFTRLSPAGRLLPLDGGFTAEAVSGSIRRRLHQVLGPDSQRI